MFLAQEDSEWRSSGFRCAEVVRLGQRPTNLDVELMAEKQDRTSGDIVRITVRGAFTAMRP